MANDFSGDPNCVAVYRFESSALTTDSKGTNTLTNANTVAENTTDFDEGACSADFEASSNQKLYRSDANLSSDFPFKSGSSNQIQTITARFRLESIAEGMWAHIASKASTDSPTSISWQLGVIHSSGTYKVRFHIYYTNSWVSDALEIVFSPVVDKWYRVAVAFNNNNGAVFMKLVNADGDLSETASATLPHAMWLTNADFTIGAVANNQYFWDGEIDEVVIFKIVLTEEEIDNIFAGTYAYAPPVESDIQVNQYNFNNMRA